MELGGSYALIPFGPGTGLAVQEIEGLDMPELRTSNVPRALDHGARMGRNLFGERTVTISFGVYGPTVSDFEDAASTLQRMVALQDQEYPLYFDGGSRFVNGRVVRASLPRDFTGSEAQRIGFATIQWTCTDPRIYDAQQNSSVIGLPLATEGASYPIDFPISFGTVATGAGAFQVVNDGNFEAPWVGVIDAGQNFVSGPRIENVTTGQVLDFTGLVLQPGQFLALDAHERTAYLNGQASRYGTLSSTSRWFYLQPGVNEIRSRAASAATGSKFTITWRSASI